LALLLPFCVYPSNIYIYIFVFQLSPFVLKEKFNNKGRDRGLTEKGRERERRCLGGFLLGLLPLIYTPVESYNGEEGNACIYNYGEWVWKKGTGITTKIWFLIILGCVSLVLIGGKWRLFYWFFLHYER